MKKDDGSGNGKGRWQKGKGTAGHGDDGGEGMKKRKALESSVSSFGYEGDAIPTGRELDGSATVSRILLRLQTGLFKFGYKAARKGGDTRADSQRLGAVQAHAEGMAREQAASAFDPATSLRDKVRLREFEERQERVAEERNALSLAEGESRQRRDWVAEVGSEGTPPRFPWPFAIGGALLIACTVAPALRDRLVAGSGAGSPAFVWTLSLIPSTLAGMAIMFALLGTYRGGSADRAIRVLGLLGGVAFAVAVGALRLLGGSGLSGILLAVGLSVLEFAVVLLADAVGRGLREKHAHYAETIAERQRREAILAASEAEVERGKVRISELEAGNDEFLDELEEREIRSRHLSALVEAAVKAVTDGFMDGIASNVARLRQGPAAKVEDDDEEEE